MAEKKLYRSRKDRVIAGVCGGVAEYFDIDATIVRLAWALTVLVGGFGILAYIISLIIIPEEPKGKSKKKETKVNINEKEGMIIGGLALLFFGLIFLTSALGIFSWGIWKYIWPSILIFIGLILVLFPKRSW